MKIAILLLATTAIVAAQTTVFSWTGSTPTDHLGTSLAGPGDLNGDGVPDIVIGAASTESQNPTAGFVAARSGADGSILWQTSGIVSYERFGTCVRSAGDVTGDGINDIVVAAPGARGVVLLSGLDGSVIRSMADPCDKVDGGHDYNGDGVPDQLGCYLVGQTTGGVKVYSGVNGSVLLNVLPGMYGLTGNGTPSFRANFITDTDHDGFDDVLVTREVSGVAVRVRGPNGAGGGAVTAPGLFSSGISDVGSVTGDDLHDAAVSRYLFASLFTYYFTVYNSATGAIVWERSVVPASTGGLVIYGWDTSRLPDLDGDGRPEILANSVVFPGGPNSPTATGATVLSGATGATIMSVFTPTVMTTLSSVATIGDVTGDGVPEFAFGNPGSANNPGYVAVVSPVSLPQASVIDLGGACGAYTTALTTTLPVVGSAVTLSIVGGAPSAPASIVGDFAPDVSTPYGSCIIHLDLTHVAEWSQFPLVLDPTGSGSLSLPVPSVPALANAVATLQAVVWGTGVPNGFDLSNGLRVTLGY